MIFVILAAVFTAINWIFYKSGKAYAPYMGLALACVALAMCGEYHNVALWVSKQDWSAMEDVVPTIERILWISVSSFSVLNIAPAFLDAHKHRKPKEGERLG